MATDLESSGKSARSDVMVTSKLRGACALHSTVHYIVLYVVTTPEPIEYH